MIDLSADPMSLSKISSKSWQSRNIRSEGQRYTSPEEVHNRFEGLKKAALILGRLETYQELDILVSQDLCRRYAPLLEVLRLLARDWLEQDIQGGPSDNAEIERPIDIWTVAMKGLEFPVEHELSEEDFVETSDCVSSEDEAGSSTSPEPTSVTESVYCDSSSAISPDLVQELAMRYIKRYPEDTLETPGDLPHGAIIKELKLQLLELPFLEPLSITGITSNCMRSISSKFQQLSMRIWSLDEPQRSCVFRMIRGSGSSTIIQLQLSVESLLADLVPASVAASSDKVELDEFRRKQALLRAENKVNPLQYLPRSMKADVFSQISASVYCAPLPKASSSQSIRMFDLWFLESGKHLLDSGLRRDLAKVWAKLSCVFLAQDANMLSTLHDWLELVRLSDCHLGSEETELLRETWPFTDMQLSQELRPILLIELPPALELYFGENLEFLFSKRLLEQCWDRVVKGFLESDPLLEKEMASVSRGVFDKIDRLEVLNLNKPLFG